MNVIIQPLPFNPGSSSGQMYFKLTVEVASNGGLAKQEANKSFRIAIDTYHLFKTVVV